MISGTKADILGELEKEAQRVADGKTPRPLFDFEIIPEVGEKDDYVPTPTGQKLHNDSAVLRLARGPLGSGKSYAMCRDLVAISSSVPRDGGTTAKSIGMMVRNTASQLKDTSIRIWCDAFPQVLPCRFLSSENRFESSFVAIDENGEEYRVEMEVLFRAFELQKDIKKLLSTNLTWFAANEARELPAHVLTNGLTRTGRYPNLPQELRRMWAIGDTNSFDKVHPLYDLFYRQSADMVQPVIDAVRKAGGSDDMRIISAIDWPGGRSPEAENLENLPPGYYEINALANGEKWAKIYCDNEFGAYVDGDVLYSNFNASHHIIDDEDPPPGSELYIGTDGGREAAYALFADYPDGRTVLIDEMSFHEEPKPLAVSAPMAAQYFDRKYPRDKYKRAMGGHDPGLDASWQNDDVKSQDIVIEAFENRGWRTGKVWTNDPQSRVEVVNKMLDQNIGGKPKFAILRRCQWAITCVERYHRRRLNIRTSDGSHRLSPQAEKDSYSHMAEAVQYGLMVRGKGSKIIYSERKRSSGVIVPQTWSPLA